MIVRQYVLCCECGTAHVLRIGLGGEPVQTHRFPCTACGQEMGIGLEQGVGWRCGPSTESSEENNDASIVNLHPSFVFQKGETGSAHAFPSLEIGRRMIQAVMATRERAGLPADLGVLAGAVPRRTGLSGFPCVGGRLNITPPWP